MFGTTALHRTLATRADVVVLLKFSTVTSRIWVELELMRFLLPVAPMNRDIAC